MHLSDHTELCHIYKRYLYLRKRTKIIIEEKIIRLQLLTYIFSSAQFLLQKTTTTTHLGKNTAVVEMLVQHEIEISFFFLNF